MRDGVELHFIPAADDEQTTIFPKKLVKTTTQSYNQFDVTVNVNNMSKKNRGRHRHTTLTNK